MSITDHIHRKNIELQDVYGTLRGISPKLSLHASLTARVKVIETEIAELEQKRGATLAYKPLETTGPVQSSHSIDVNGYCNLGCC